MYVARGNSFLPDFSLKNLEDKYAQEANVKAKIRLQCAVLRKKGKSMLYIAEVTGKRELRALNNPAALGYSKPSDVICVWIRKT